MKRAIKVLLALGCCVLCSQVALYPESFFDTDADWIYQVISSLSFIVMMYIGCYGIIKMLPPIICRKEELKGYKAQVRPLTVHNN